MKKKKSPKVNKKEKSGNWAKLLLYKESQLQFILWLKVKDGRYRGGKYRNYSQLKDINNKFSWNEYEY